MSPQGTNPTAAVDTHPPIKWNPIAADLCLALLFSAMNMGGRMQYAPTRTSDNGRCRSFAPKMFSNCGGCLSGAIVPYQEHGGAYAIRPYTDVRQWPLSFVRPRNVFRLRRMPVGRYCFLPGTWGAYAFAPLHGRPTMAADVHSPPKWFPMAADTCRALLFSARNIGGVCNTPLHGRPTAAPVVRSPQSESIL